MLTGLSIITSSILNHEISHLHVMWISEHSIQWNSSGITETPDDSRFAAETHHERKEWWKYIQLHCWLNYIVCTTGCLNTISFFLITCTRSITSLKIKLVLQLTKRHWSPTSDYSGNTEIPAACSQTKVWKNWKRYSTIHILFTLSTRPRKFKGHSRREIPPPSPNYDRSIFQNFVTISNTKFPKTVIVMTIVTRDATLHRCTICFHVCQSTQHPNSNINYFNLTKNEGGGGLWNRAALGKCLVCLCCSAGPAFAPMY
jgi:hypothetical protein